MGEGNKRMSKRDAGSGLVEYIERGFLPEGVLNYLALLGWGIADDRDVFTMAEMIDVFDIRRVNPNAARFDLKKCEAINAAHLRMLVGRRARRPRDPVPAGCPAARRRGHAERPRDLVGGRAADPRADDDAGRVGRR